MKILFISHDDGKYGAALSLKKLFTILKENYGVEPIIVTRKYNELNMYCEQIGVESYALHYVGCITKISKSKFERLYNSAVQTTKNNIFHIIAEKELKKYVDLETIDLIYTNVSTIDFGAWLAKKYKIHHIWHIREFMDEDIKGRPASSKYYKLMNQSDAVIAISKKIAEKWKEKGIDPRIINVIYNGIEDNPNYIKRTNFYNGGILHTVFMGSAAPHKGLEHLIDAIKIVYEHNKSIQLDVYGNYENDYGKSLQEKVKNMGLEHVIIFKGYCSNIFEVLHNYDVGFVCSKAEGFGRVTVEFMLNELAVIASDTGANPELIDNGETGILYSFGNHEDLSEKIELLYNDNSLIKKFAINGRIKALNQFTASMNAANIYNILTKFG